MRRRRRATHDELGIETLVARGAALQPGDQHAGRVFCDHIGALLRRGDRRPRVPGKGTVLEAGDRDVVRDAETHRARRRHRARRNFIVAAKNGGRRTGKIQKAPRAAKAVVEQVVTGHQQFLAHGHPVVAQGGFVAAQAFGAGVMVGSALQKADARVAKLQQMGGDRVRRAAVVDVHAGSRAARVADRRDDPHERNPEGDELAQGFRTLRDGRRQDQAGKAQAMHEGPEAIRQVTCQRVAGIHLQSEAVGAARPERPLLQRDDVVGVGVVVGKADRVGVRPAEGARERARVIVELFDRTQHPLARLRADAALAIDHA